MLNPFVAPAEVQRPPAEPDPYLYRVRDLVCLASGIFHTESKFYFLMDRCQRRMDAVGAQTMADYFQLLSFGRNRDIELRDLLNEITVGETCFFRNQPQLDALHKSVLPETIATKTRIGFTRLRVWSAGCSTGEEAYTLAMALMEESQAQLKGWTFEVVATDLNDKSLARAREGVYSDYALRNIPPYFKQKYLVPAGNNFRVRDEVKACVNFSRLNLRDDSKMVFMKGMDVIFCCNVLIYFGSQPKRMVVQHFFNNLIPGGYLFLGHSESLFGLNDDFKLVHFPLATGYRRPRPEAGMMR